MAKPPLPELLTKPPKCFRSREIKTVELKMSGGTTACIMKCIFKYERSGKEEFLEGTFTSKYEEGWT